MGGIIGGLAPIAIAAASGNPIGLAFAVLSFGLQVVSSLTQKKKKAKFDTPFEDRAQDLSVTVRSSVEPRRIVIGTTKIGGVLVYATSTGKSNKFAHLVILFCDGRIKGFKTVLFGDDEISIAALDSNNRVTSGKYAGLVQINHHRGLPDQLADADLVAVAPAGEWTSAHRLRGIAYCYIRLEFKESVFPNGLPQISAVIEGNDQIENTRTQVVGFSNNPGDVIHWYLRDQDIGMKARPDEVDLAAFQAAANVSDENVPLQAGGDQKRYTADGVIYYGTDKPGEIMESLITSLGGVLTFSEWTYRLYAGEYRSPQITIDEHANAGDITWAPRPERRQIFNRARAKVIDPTRKYEITDVPERRNATYEAEDGVAIVREFPLPFTQDTTRAQRLLEIRLKKSRAGALVWPGNMKCRAVAVAEPIAVNVARINFSGRVFMPVTFKYSPATLVELELVEEKASYYAWSAGDALDPGQPPGVQEPDNPAPIVESLFAQQTGPSEVTITIEEVEPRPFAYNYYFAPEGGSLAEARTIDNLERGTAVLTAVIPPGSWIIFVTAVDEYGVESSDAASTLVIVQNFFDIVAGGYENPEWIGSISGFHRHWTGVLTPASTKRPNELTREELFDSYVPYPVAAPFVEFSGPNELDLEFDAAGVRVFPELVAPPGGGVAIEDAGGNGRVDIDYRLEAGFYEGWKINWSNGIINFRYLKHRVVFASPRRYVASYGIFADVQESVISGEVANVPSAWATISFPQRFHRPPSVAPRVADAPFFVLYRNVTETGFEAHVVDSSNADQTPQEIVYDAVGPLGRVAM